MNKQKIIDLDNIILMCEKNIKDKSNNLLNDNDLDSFLYENNVVNENELLIKINENKAKILSLLDEIFDENGAIVDLKPLKNYLHASNTYNIIYKYLIDNGFMVSEDLSLLNTDSVTQFFLDMESYPRLSKEKQNECLTKNNELLQKSNDCIKYILSYYIDLIDKYFLKYSSFKHEYNFIKQYLIKFILQSIYDKTIFFDKEKIDLLLDKKLEMATNHSLSYYNVNKNIERKYEFDKYIVDDIVDKKCAIKKYKEYLENEKQRNDIKNYITEHNLRFVVSIAKNYINKGLSFSDLIQEGTMGLMKSLDLYDPNIAAFSTYATWWVKQSIVRAIENTSKMIRLPVHFNDKFKKYKSFYVKYTNEHGVNPTDEIIKEELNLTDSDLKEFNYYIFSEVSLNDVVGEDDHGVSDEIGDFIEDDKINVENEAINNKIKTDLFQILKTLPEEQLAVILMRFGITIDDPIIVEKRNIILLLTSDIEINYDNVNQYLIENNRLDIYHKIVSNNHYDFKIIYLKGYPMTLEEVGSAFNYTRERARQKEVYAIKRLRLPGNIKKINYLDY